MADTKGGPMIWYPTAPTRRLTQPGGGTWALDGTIHAGEVGVASTACGLAAHQWPMLFYRQFDPCGPAACASCAALVIIGEKGGTSSQGPSAR